MSLNVVIISFGRLSSKGECICDKSDLQFSKDMEKNIVRHSSLYSQLSQHVLAVAADRMLAHMNKWSGQMWQIISACSKALGAHFSLVFLWLCFCTYANPWLL